jgi:dihydrofolate reductase
MQLNKKLKLIIASKFDGGIGYDNKIPWYCPKELQKFKEITQKVENSDKINAVVMGRNTWESLPRRPLANRVNIIITSDNKYKTPYKNVIILNSLHSMLMYCNCNEEIESIFVIGGAQIYNQIIFNDFFRKRIEKIFLSVMFYKKEHVVNKHIDMPHLLDIFYWEKDKRYQQESDDRLFASYILYPMS